MFSGVKPNFFCNSLIGAEAPKVSMPMVWPRRPTYRAHPRVEPSSTETRAVTDFRQQLFTILGVLTAMVFEDLP